MSVIAMVILFIIISILICGVALGGGYLVGKIIAGISKACHPRAKEEKGQVLKHGWEWQREQKR